KYSLSEIDHHKSVTMVEMGEKGTVTISELPLTPLREMRLIRGTYQTIMKRDNYIGTNTDDYVHIVLTDETDQPEAMARLRQVYPNLMRLTYDNRRTHAAGWVSPKTVTEKKSPTRHFGELFELQNGRPMAEEQEAYVERIFREIWGEVAGR
ncbi:MAG: exonuclease SbcCD subunit D C-terminal domain-containing protein, partial [Lachnospiraceae bacterium]|nr:exonuclease SbcCD subunit D C-terminal domain-containing protein [Lachnospiraceae bacterium]